MIMDDERFIEWEKSTSSNNKKLHDRLYDFGDYFSDMLFEEGTSAGEFIKCQSKMDNDWQDDVIDRPDEFVNFSYSYFKTKVEPCKNRGGYFDAKEQCLCISTENLEKDDVILHEMIHLHEYVLNEHPLFYHDTLLWSLYFDLRKKINNLDNVIMEHAYILNEQSIYNRGGLHDVLFLLKSLDLDMRMGYQLGTVFGYEMEEQLKGVTYKVED